MLSFNILVGDDPVKVEFEHSLLAMSKWESIYKTPFFSRTEKSAKQLLEYFECMVVTPGVDPNIVYAMTSADQIRLKEYLEESPTASSVPRPKTGSRSETVTTELIYYWMVGLEIPWDAQHWNIYRLLMLIEITNYKKQPPTKQSKADMLDRWKAANEARKKQYNSNG